MMGRGVGATTAPYIQVHTLQSRSKIGNSNGFTSQLSEPTAPKPTRLCKQANLMLCIQGKFTKTYSKLLAINTQELLTKTILKISADSREMNYM